MTPGTLFPGPPPWLVPPAKLPIVRRIAVVAPHPDDFDAIGVTMRMFHAQGAAINIAVLTPGASGIEDGFAGANTDEEKARVREVEQTASVAWFGLGPGQLRFLRLTGDHGQLADSPINQAAIRQFLEHCQADLIFLPHGNDANVAHQRTFALVSRARADLKSDAMLVLNRDPKTIALREDLFVTFDESTAEWKRQLLRHHASQQSRNLRTRGVGFDERILADNARTADRIGQPERYAESFEVSAVR